MQHMKMKPDIVAFIGRRCDVDVELLLVLSKAPVHAMPLSHVPDRLDCLTDADGC